MTELKDTVDGMLSGDYKERLRAEIDQLKIRKEGLRKMLDDWTLGKLRFAPACPRSVFELQLRSMNDYLTALEARARIEGIR